MTVSCDRDGWSVGEGGLSPPGSQYLPAGNVPMEGGRGEAGGQGACFQGGPAGGWRKTLRERLDLCHYMWVYY